MHPKGPDQTANPATLQKSGIDKLSQEIPADSKAGANAAVKK